MPDPAEHDHSGHIRPPAAKGIFYKDHAALCGVVVCREKSIRSQAIDATLPFAFPTTRRPVDAALQLTPCGAHVLDVRLFQHRPSVVCADGGDDSGAVEAYVHNSQAF